MKAPENNPKVTLVGEGGNSFAIMAKVKRALVKAGADKEYVASYFDKATAGNYDHLLQVTMEYVEVS